MSKIGFGERDNTCVSCPLFPDMCYPECEFADKTHVNPNEIVPDELIPWLRKNKENGPVD